MLAAVERRLAGPPLTFYLTWDVDDLPAYGADVVAVVLGDELARMPAYAGRVRAVFKCYGTRQALGADPLRHPSYANLRAAAHLLRAELARRLAAARGARPRVAANVYDIPLGYYNQLDLPVRDIAARRCDVFFAGSVVHDPARVPVAQRLLGTPKGLSRARMLAELARLAERHPGLVVRTTTTAGFNAVRTADPRSYSEQLMDAKVCLAPRGTSLETFRVFEGLRYGCVVVTEALPPRWFYDGAPVVRVHDWGELEPAVLGALTDERTLRDRHARSLGWWDEKCSEDAVGAYIAARVGAGAG